MSDSIKGVLALLAVTLALVTAGCGQGSGGESGRQGAAIAGCLEPEEVREEINRIAEGFESSSEEVEAKQEAIQAIEAEAC
ncbi:MAG TPA: hypothetical protein VF093_00395 [Solirubrobacterales bacterium]